MQGEMQGYIDNKILPKCIRKNEFYLKFWRAYKLYFWKKNAQYNFLKFVDKHHFEILIISPFAENDHTNNNKLRKIVKAHL